MSFNSLDRRRLLLAAGGAAFTSAIWTTGRAAAVDPFTLGVASGDPSSDGFVLWTRLAVNPLAPDGWGGMNAPIHVTWQVAEDEGMRRIVRTGHDIAQDAFAHSLHVEVAGLKPNRPYWYRFQAMGARSRIGRTRTAPAPGQKLDKLTFAAASCSDWEVGYFSAYRHMAEAQPDLVLFLGDYMYEYSYPAAQMGGHVVRPHDQPGEVITLAQYRNRYALHHTDPDLQALHAAAPALMTWDDHEVSNDYANRWSQDPKVTEAAFLERRAAAYRAFYENMPVRRFSFPNGPDGRVYGGFGFGDLAQFLVMDGRQYRTKQPCELPNSRRGHVAPESCPDLADPSRTMLGLAQETWLYDQFRKSRAKWTIMAQDLLIAPVLQSAADGTVGHYTDGWDGYQATRGRMLQAVADSKVANPVFLGGDIHSFWATDLKTNFADPSAPAIASEFVGTSITSDNPPWVQAADPAAHNAHIKYADGTTHGYMAFDLTPERLETRFQVISDRKDPKATLSTLKKFVVEAGKPGVQIA